MDSSKRQFLQQLGVLTAGASLVPLAEAKFPFRRSGMKALPTPLRHAYRPAALYRLSVLYRKLHY